MIKPIITVTASALIGVVALTNLPEPFNFLVGLLVTFFGGVIYHSQFLELENEEKTKTKRK